MIKYTDAIANLFDVTVKLIAVSCSSRSTNFNDLNFKKFLTVYKSYIIIIMLMHEKIRFIFGSDKILPFVRVIFQESK